MPARCKTCSGKLILEERAEVLARYEIGDDGSYRCCPIEKCEDFIYEIVCERDCDETGYKFDRYAGRAIKVQE